MNVLSSAIVLIACLGQGDPGTIAVVNGDLAVVTFELAGGTQYQVDYPAQLENVWLDRAMTTPAAPLTTYTARSLGDFNGDDVLNGLDIDGFQTVLVNGPFNPEADFDNNGVLDINDIPGFVEAVLAPYPADGVILYVQGLMASTALGDAAIDLYTGTPFILTDTELVTVVDVTISPLSGPVGAPITITMTPAIAPLAFDANTTARWNGIFQPTIGAPSAPFIIRYSAAQFRESSSSEAVLFVGDGTVINTPDLASHEGPGTTEGAITLDFGGPTLARPLDFAPELDAAKWEWIDYPDGPGGLDAPQLGGEPSQLNPWMLGFLQIPDPPEASMLNANGFHHAVVVRIEQNATTIADSPETVSVDLVSFDQGQVELDRVENLSLGKVPGDDGDPLHIVYHNDLYHPVILVDVQLNKENYPNIVLLKIEQGGTAVIIPATN